MFFDKPDNSWEAKLNKVAGLKPDWRKIGDHDSVHNFESEMAALEAELSKAPTSPETDEVRRRLNMLRYHS